MERDSPPKSEEEEENELNKKTCSRFMYARGAGHEAHKCGKLSEQIASDHKCYPHCKPNYLSRGEMCIQKCPEGFGDFIDQGLCMKPMGYQRKSTKTRCDDGEEKIGLFCYAKCREPFHPALNFRRSCKADCPKGMKSMDDLRCLSDSYRRGEVEPPVCDEGHELFVDKCYPSCEEGYEGVAEACWSKCP